MRARCCSPIVMEIQAKTPKKSMQTTQKDKPHKGKFDSLVLDALHVRNVLLALLSIEATEFLSTVYRQVLHSLILRRCVL